jgi:hypothetical protein
MSSLTRSDLFQTCVPVPPIISSTLYIGVGRQQVAQYSRENRRTLASPMQSVAANMLILRI